MKYRPRSVTKPGDATRPPRVHSKGAPETIDWFKRTIDVLTLLVIATGLYFAWDQAEKLNRNLVISNQNNNLSTWSTVANETLEIDKVMIANPDFAKYLFEGATIEKTDKDYPRASAIATLYLDYFDSVLTLLAYMLPDPPPSAESKKSDRSPPHGDHVLKMVLERDAWLNYIRSTFRSSPLLCASLRDNWDSYGSQTQQLAGPICRPSPR